MTAQRQLGRIYAVTAAISAYYADRVTPVICQMCGHTRVVREHQAFVPEGRPRQYRPPEDSGCPKCGCIA